MIDVCLIDDVKNVSLCQAIEAYVSECQDAGVAVPVWRRPHLCRKLQKVKISNKKSL